MTSITDSRFFSLVGVAFLAVAVIGFGPSFGYALLRSPAQISPALYFHAFVMFGWLGIYIVQSMLPARGKLLWHKRLGYVACGLFIVIWISSTTISISSFSSPLPEPVRTLINNIFFLQIVSWFIAPVLFALAIRSRKKIPVDHKRYMLLLTFFLLEAAFSRMTWLPGMSSEQYWVIFQYLYCDLFLVALVWFDLRTMEKLAYATKVGLGILLPYQLIAIMVWGSEWWLSIANQLLAILT